MCVCITQTITHSVLQLYIFKVLYADINECSRPNFCKGICQNTEGNYSCIGCPSGTYFDPVETKCIPNQPHERRHNIVIGILHRTVHFVPVKFDKCTRYCRN